MQEKSKFWAKILAAVILVGLLFVFPYYVWHGAQSFLSPENLPLVVFSLGILFQIILIAREKAFNRLALFLFCFSLVTMAIPGKSETVEEYNLAIHFLFGVLFSAVFASVLLRDRILIKLSEFKLLFFSMMVSYAVYAFYGTGLFFLLSLAPLAVILFFCLTKAVPSGKARLLLYVWALLAWVGFCAVLLEKFFIGAVRSYLSPLAHSAPITFPLADYFFFGMSFFLLFSLAFYLYLLLPITGKNERFEQALKRSKEMAQAMVAKFDDSNANRIAALLALFLFGGFLALNSALNLFEPVAVIAFFLSANGLIDYIPKWQEKAKTKT